MNIAILRTDRADDERAYNKLEYAAALYGARVVAYVDPSGAGEVRGQPTIPPARCASLDVDLVVAASPLTSELRSAFEAVGWPSDRLLSHATDALVCQRRWQEGDAWLVARQPAVSQDALDVRASYARLGDPAVDPVPSSLSPADHRAVTIRVLDAYRRAVRDAPTDGPFAIGGNWSGFLRATRGQFYEAVARDDIDAIAAMLASCLRNETTTGTFGGREAYEAWVDAGPGVAAGVAQQFNVWRYSVRDADLSRVVSPPVGNPYGLWIDGGIVHPNTFFNDYRAELVRGLVENVERPIVVDLGGGFGGFGHQLVDRGHDAVYVGFDLPDNLIVASYFLSAAHPDKRVMLYESSSQSLDSETLRSHDIVLMPNFMLPRVADRCVDVFTNFISLSEMDYPTIVSYLNEVDRVCAGYFYHENLLDNGENYTFFPVPVFPALSHFKQLSASPSRWPFFSPTSPNHCHGEFLSIRRDLDQRRYLGVRDDRRADDDRERVSPTEVMVGSGCDQ